MSGVIWNVRRDVILLNCFVASMNLGNITVVTNYRKVTALVVFAFSVQEVANH